VAKTAAVNNKKNRKIFDEIKGEKRLIKIKRQIQRSRAKNARRRFIRDAEFFFTFNLLIILFEKFG